MANVIYNKQGEPFSFDNFKLIIRQAEIDGIISFSERLTELELAVQFAANLLSQEGKKKFTARDLYNKIIEFAPYLFDEDYEED